MNKSSANARLILLLLLTGLYGGTVNPPTFAAPTSEPRLLWELGKPDHNNAEFALAPGHFQSFREDGFFVIGQSDPQRDWPYVQPGPGDGWAGNRPHTFTLLFGLVRTPTEGGCMLRLALLDTHNQAPPELRIAVNGTPVQTTASQSTFRLPSGAGDASVLGEPAKGKAHQLDVAFPANLLKSGANEIAITTVTGSWLLYDWIGFEAPPALELDAVSGTALGAVRSPPVLVERGSQLTQTVEVTLRHFGEPQDVTVRLGDLATRTQRLERGQQTLEFAVPAVAKETPLEVSVEANGKPVGTQTVTLKPVRKWVVYLLPHSHVDIGYTHVQTDVERAQWKYLEMGMEAARNSANNPPGARFKWNVEVLWAVDSYLKQATPEKRQAFFEAVRAGQVGLQALYGNELTGLCRPEELLRLLSYAQRLSQQADAPIASAMITDVPGYTWGIVPTFAHSGVKYFSIGPNGGDRIGHTIAAWGDKPFWWIGPNGRDKVLVWMTGTGYYQVFQSPDKLLGYLAQLDAKGYPYDFVQVRHCLGDNGAPDVNFADKVRAWNETHAYPKLIIATSEEMFRDFEQRYGDQIPTAQGDFTPYWEDGAASSALETAMNRASADRLTQAETLFALFNPKAYPAEEFQKAWRNVMLYDEHTWGAHNSISEPDAPFVKSQWAIKRQFAFDADAESRALLAKADEARGKPISLSTIGGEGRGEGADTPVRSTVPPKVQAIDVINTTSISIPWALVVVPKELSTAGDGIAVSPTNKAILVSQRLTTGELVFRPCWGSYSAYRYYVTNRTPATPQEAFPAARAEGTTLISTNSAVAGRLTLRLDEQTGSIASLLHDGRELVDTNAPTGLNDYFYLPGSDLKGLQRNGPVKISVKERGPLIASLLVESDAPGCRKLAREYRLHALRNYLEIIDTVDKLPVRAKEGVHFGFGFNVPDGVVRMDVPWGVVRPEVDQIPGACKNWFTVQRWVDVSNDKFGVTWMTPDAPLVEVDGITASLIGSLSDPRAWLDHLEPSQTIYSWAMNNHWHTNYRAEQEGPTVFRYFIWPHDWAFSEAQVTARALELNQPLLVLPARGAAPQYPPRLQVHEEENSTRPHITAFKPSDDGKAWIVRLFNAADRSSTVKLAWSDPQPPSTWLSDNSEKPLSPVTGPIEVPARSLVTVRAGLP
jgi:alpha-mannosidase